MLDKHLIDLCGKKVTGKIKRGCSEFVLEIPEYGEITNDRIAEMDYPKVWKPEEEKFDLATPINAGKRVDPSLSEFCLSDFYILQKWIDYAKGLGDPVCEPFADKPIIYKDVYDIAVQRKKAFGTPF